jgi:signal transduction histidine kinase
MHRTSIRTHLILTYFTSVVLAVTVVPLSYHWLAGLFGFGIPSSYPGTLGLIMLGAASVSLLYGYAMGSGIIRRVQTLAAGAQRIAAGDLETRIPARGADELAQLGTTLNEMMTRLRKSLDQQKKSERARRDLVANVAHDLRTPLAAVQAAVEALETGVVEDEAARTRCLTAISRETRHLSRLIDDLFALSQLEAGQLELKPEKLYLEDIVQDCLIGLLPQVEQQGIALTVDLPAILPPVWADRLATRRVLANLLQNALAFTPTGERIAVQGTMVADGVRIKVSDTGPGIPSQDLEPGPDGQARIFQRFYRGDEARSGGGAGLGLAIARELVQAQGGHIEAASVVGEGTTIGFTLPRGE